MKLLPFEGRYLLETSDCPRCEGTGKFAHARSGDSADCYSCRGWARKATPAGLKLFYSICDLLGKPMSQEMREGRVEPKYLDSIFARDVVVGMQVRVIDAGGARDWPEVVTQIEIAGLSSRRIHFDNTVRVVSEFALLDRQLTAEEIEGVQAHLAEHVGNGAVIGSEVER